MSAIETTTKSIDNSPKISIKHLEQTSGTGNYLVLSRTLASVLTVSLSDQTILLQLASTINFRITQIVSKNFVDYPVYGPVSYPCNILYYPWLYVLVIPWPSVVSGIYHNEHSERKVVGERGNVYFLVLWYK